jgi:5'-3' exonuclease
MGVAMLNRFIKELRSPVSKKIPLIQLRGKKIVIDASIYLYRFASQGGLIEYLFEMCCIFRHLEIHALFIFDGESPPEKNDERARRAKKRAAAREKYALIENELKNTMVADKQRVLRLALKKLRGSTVRITFQDIQRAKLVIEGSGLHYTVSKGEADALCAALVTKGAAYACLSEDTDMFAYGCPRILKYLSLLHRTAVIYDTEKVRDQLGMSAKEFTELCVLAGTDYKETPCSIFKGYNLFRTYNATEREGFLEWLRGRHISMQDYYALKDVVDIYDLEDTRILSTMKYVPIYNTRIDRKKLSSVLPSGGFIIC